MRRKDRERLATLLAKQGVDIKKTRAGYIVRTPLGTAGWHTNQTGPRNDKNLRKDIERIGLTWPL